MKKDSLDMLNEAANVVEQAHKGLAKKKHARKMEGSPEEEAADAGQGEGPVDKKADKMAAMKPLKGQFKPKK